MTFKYIFKMILTIGIIQIFLFNSHAESNLVSKKNYTFEYPFKDVWAATQIILGTYPLETNDLQNGLIKTTDLKPGQFWQPPFEKSIEQKYSQQITFKFFKISPNRTELQILKQANLETDFLGSSKPVKTEPWEELRLIYKIKREIEIKKILSRI
jgi:hypothetical protein